MKRRPTEPRMRAIDRTLRTLRVPYARWEQRARKRLIEILARLVQGRGVALLPAFSP